MSHFMRRHKKIIFWSLVILVVPTFIYWGANVGGSGNGRDGQTPTIVGQVGPIPITAERLRNKLNEEAQRQGRGAKKPTYADLMTGTDAAGLSRSFLATSESFLFLRGLHTRNLIVPVVGDFAGSKALRGIGRYLADKQTIVGAFYLSNVEQYLGREGRWSLFCENVATMPLDETSSFIRSVRDGTYGRGMGLNSVTGRMLAETEACPR
jgi:hypothetical protein